jgi:hypothetical protein
METGSESRLVAYSGLYFACWWLSAATWYVTHGIYANDIGGDGGLGAMTGLMMVGVGVFLVVVGVLTLRETVGELPTRPGRLATTRVIGLGVVIWVVERQALVAGGREVATAVALVASLLMPAAFIAALLLVTGGKPGRRRAGLMSVGLAVALVLLRLA